MMLSLVLKKLRWDYFPLTKSAQLFSKLPFEVKAPNRCKMLRMDTRNDFIQRKF